MPSTYYAHKGRVFMADGPWEASLTPAQTESLLDIFQEANAVTHFNALHQACQQAGYLVDPNPFDKPASKTPRLVVVASNNIETALAAHKLETQP